MMYDRKVHYTEINKLIVMDKYEQSVVDTERYEAAKLILKGTFGYDNFKPYQYQIIDNILNENDVMAVMPTGYGKSLCFQIAPLLTNEVAIVISPLIALMVDQKMILDKLGISSCCYNSTQGAKSKREMEEGLISGDYRIMYITPESLVKSHKLIDQIYENVGICMIAIDEAHCLSSYGFDFRPKYREIVKIRKVLKGVPVLAVTATATSKVINDIRFIMNMEDGELIKTSFDRPNLMIHVKLQSQRTVEEIVEIVENTEGPSIVYCLTKADTEKMAEKLTKAGVSSKAYHGGLTKVQRTEAQEEFMNGEYDCITATIAFGMGINKSDIRTVIHYGCPQNIESYYQEIGRAGRDGKESNCYLFYKQKDFIIQQRFINEIKDPRYKIVRKKLLHDISQYVGTDKCRRKLILKYFDQELDKKNCKKCDNCTSKKKKIKKCDEYKLFQVLSTVLSIQTAKGYGYGMSTISLILKGSRSKSVKDWMKKLTYYGSMGSATIKEINGFIYKTVDLGYLENHDVGDCVHVLRCTDQGLLFGKKYEKKLNDMLDDQNSMLKGGSKSLRLG